MSLLVVCEPSGAVCCAVVALYGTASVKQLCCRYGTSDEIVFYASRSGVCFNQ